MRHCSKGWGFWRPLENPKLSSPGSVSQTRRADQERRPPDPQGDLGRERPSPHSLLFVFSFTLSGPSRQQGCLFTSSHSIHTSLQVFIFALVLQRCRQRYKHGTKLLWSLNNLVLSVVDTSKLREFGRFSAYGKHGGEDASKPVTWNQISHC